MNDRVVSVNGVPIRITAERWQHIVEHHDDLAGYYHDVLEAIQAPDAVYHGAAGELLAVTGKFRPRHLVVVYRETSATDGFLITAFFTSRIRHIERRELAWKKASS